MPDPRWTLRTVLTDNPDETVKQYRDTTPEEKIVVGALTDSLNSREGVWATKEFDLWQEVSDYAGASVPPENAVQKLGHPLQPDIDVLLTRQKDGEIKRPYVGIEVKYFRKYTGIDGHKFLPKLVGPKGNDLGGFYSGLGQALSLVGMGLDYVYLWHVFKIDDELARDGNIEGHIDVLDTYSTRLVETMDSTNLPIGYYAHGIAVDHNNRLINISSERPLLDRDPIPKAHTCASNLPGFLREALSKRESPDPLDELNGSGQQICVEATVEEIFYTSSNRDDDSPDLKGQLCTPSSTARVPFVVYNLDRRPFLEEGETYRFERAIDHLYNDEVQLLAGDDCSVISL